ncbi:polysaccharide biosynthesis/export family protein [Acinetobacter bereziniae]|uniref:polysaccharide biosynthesis/export family protein n=1 Tax=Acinetobacter bereziniae TaxID=106648 RepID=UPI00124FCDE0|nr:polysaccharide biosynthesis/export family protein [Acinetobacter bereziniae]MDA3440673.1 polysaccharide biosynthesis/export family protein [Acinetobacter bereziniae]
MKYPYTSLLTILAISISFSGCAITSGLQTYDLPEQGQYKTDQGAELSVVQLTQTTIPSLNINEQAQSNDLSSLFHHQQNTYRLSSGDVLSIQLWAYPEITPPIQDATNIKAVGYPIDSNGNVQLPLVGSVRIAGKTLAETNRFLHNQFAKYLKHPDVVVRVLSYEGRRYFVNGQVMRSGQYTLNDQPISIYTALGQAGGIDTKTGDTTNIQLIRNGQTYNLNTIQLEKQGLSLHQLLIQPNDTIFVHTKQDQKLYVMGESSRSQALTLRDQGMTLSDVLGESEGISPYSASAARIYVMRTNLDTKQSTIYHLNLSSLGNLALANQFAMQKNDIVYIDATGLTRWQRIMNQIIPFSSALYSFDQLGK